MTIENGTFELGTGTGVIPSGWITNIVSQEEEWGEFAGNPSDVTTRAQEDFEKGWATEGDLVFKPAFEGPSVDLALTIFSSGPGQSPIETFERGWASGEIFIAGLQSAELAIFNAASDPASPAEVESFRFWGPEDSIGSGNTTSGPFSLEAADSEAAMFGSESVESFEAGWGNDSFSDELEEFGPEPGFFGGDDDEEVESFEHVMAPEEISVNATTNEFDFIAAPVIALAIGSPVQFETTGRLPSPIEADVIYYTTTINGSGVFKVTASVGGPSIEITDEGVGKQYLCRDPALWWTRILSV